MKKVFALLMAAAMILSLAACGNKNPDSNPDSNDDSNDKKTTLYYAWRDESTFCTIQGDVFALFVYLVAKKNRPNTIEAFCHIPSVCFPLQCETGGRMLLTGKSHRSRQDLCANLFAGFG